MKCEYCGRRVPGRLVIQGIKNCQGCGAKLPEPTYLAEVFGADVDWNDVSLTFTYTWQKYQPFQNGQGIIER